jgi:hypothetical protein
MRAKNHTRLTPRERLSRGLASTAVGPVDASSLRRRYHEGRLAHDLHSAQEALVQELAAAQDVVAGLPEALQQARRAQRRRPRPWVLAGAAAVVLAAGAAAFSIVRRSKQPEPSTLAPSVDVEPRI